MSEPTLPGMPAAPAAPAQVQIPAECAPQPLPTAWVVQALPTGLVVIQLFDATGQRVLMLDADSAQRLAADVARHASTARSGLILPGVGA